MPALAATEARMKMRIEGSGAELLDWDDEGRFEVRYACGKCGEHWLDATGFVTSTHEEQSLGWECRMCRHWNDAKLVVRP